MALDSHICENLQNHISVEFVPCLVKKILYVFQLGGGGHIVFLNFEAFAAIFELSIQKIWTQHPSIPLKTCMP